MLVFMGFFGKASEVWVTQLSNITVCDDSVTWQWGRGSGGGGWD